MGGKVTARGLDAIIKNLNAIPVMQQQHINEAMKFAGEELESAVIAKASISDYTIAELAAAGHPYAKRFGQDSASSPDEFINKQSGLLVNNIEKVINIRDDKSVIAVGVLESKVPYIGFLINGTSKMRPRDFLGHTWLEKRDKIVNIIKFGIVPGRTSRGGNV